MDMIFDSANIQAIANSIRTAGGASGRLRVTDMPDAIAEISGTSGITVDTIAQNSLAGIVILDPTTTVIGDYAFANYTHITEVDAENVTDIGNYSFAGCTSLTKVSMPNLTNSSTGHVFEGCTKLSDVNVENAVTLGEYFFNKCSALTVLVFKKMNNVWRYSMGNCTKLTTVDLTMTGNFANGQGQTFNGSNKLNTLIVRKDGVATISNINNFTNTPFASNGAGGTLYVPSAQISAYQAASNWSTILGYSNNQILPIEGSIYETQYADGTAVST